MSLKAGGLIPTIPGVERWSSHRLDYGFDRGLVLLELHYASRELIPRADSSFAQVYPPRFGWVVKDSLAFPLWDFDFVVAGLSVGELRDYVRWQTYRLGNAVYVVHNCLAREADFLFKLLRIYLEASSDADLDQLLSELEASRLSIPIAYDAAPFLQQVLRNLDLYDGRIDGRPGLKTEAGLVRLLSQLGYPCSPESLRDGVKGFQERNGLPITGHADLATIRSLAGPADSGRRPVSQ